MDNISKKQFQTSPQRTLWLKIFCLIKYKHFLYKITGCSEKMTSYFFTTILMVNSDLEKVFNVLRIRNLPFSKVPQTIKFASKVRRNNEKFHRALRVSGKQ